VGAAILKWVVCRALAFGGLMASHTMVLTQFGMVRTACELLACLIDLPSCP
jgi:hypothetical protein